MQFDPIQCLYYKVRYRGLVSLFPWLIKLIVVSKTIVTFSTEKIILIAGSIKKVNVHKICKTVFSVSVNISVYILEANPFLLQQAYSHKHTHECFPSILLYSLSLGLSLSQIDTHTQVTSQKRFEWQEGSKIVNSGLCCNIWCELLSVPQSVSLSLSHAHTHAHTHARTHAHTHTHTECVPTYNQKIWVVLLPSFLIMKGLEVFFLTHLCFLETLTQTNKNLKRA